MNLKEHLDLLGDEDGSMLAYHAQVPQRIVQRALAGQPVAETHGHAICQALSKMHGVHSADGFKPEHLDLKVIRPGDCMPIRAGTTGNDRSRQRR